MEPTEIDNSISDGASEPVAPLPQTGRGDFSLKPAGRRKGINRMVFFAIGGGILFVIVLGSLFTYAVISSMDKANPVIDENSVKAAPVLQQENQRDDSMAEAMDKLLGSKPPPATDKPADPAPNNEQKSDKAAEQNVDRKKDSVSDDAYHNNDNPYAQPQQEEQLFSKINRFESTGMSAGGGGAGYATASDGGGTAEGNGQEARLREFIKADPNELARNIANGTGASVAGSSGLSGNGGGSLLDNLDGNQYAMMKARLAPDPKFLLRRRTSFQCVLDTGIRTDYPGFVECHLMQPLYSSDGSVILARAGAQLFGEQKIEVKAGQSSVFTTWTELETSPARPGDRSIRASLNGLGTDPMGRSGTDAEIDNHWGKRIGGAVMLSTFKDVLNGGMNALSKNSNNQFTFSNTENSTEDLATKVLESTIGIPPTAYVNPGTVINVIVAQDIDFTSVYKTRR
ncbi:TrbI/VirB10 family protein [Erwinia psidii]|uniref:TrbI/VirB10 family protein n=1 Tax=Erwinia psidii TaxID=69224 RepID=UPI00226BA3AB|nr:TrbI/VirB10 family protein [Erwinia psidii]MCX8963090.1 TrbI/VirB10 family protein [Erwinia psidii]